MSFRGAIGGEMKLQDDSRHVLFCLWASLIPNGKAVEPRRLSSVETKSLRLRTLHSFEAQKAPRFGELSSWPTFVVF